MGNIISNKFSGLAVIKQTMKRYCVTNILVVEKTKTKKFLHQHLLLFYCSAFMFITHYNSICEFSIELQLLQELS